MISWRKQTVFRVLSRFLHNLYHTILYLLLVSFHWYSSVNISTLDQRCFNGVNQRWKNVDLTLKMKQNATLHFQRYTTWMQRWCPTLKQHWINVAQRRFNVVLALIWHYLNVGLTWSQRQSKAYRNQSGYWKVWICKKIDKFCSIKWKNILYNISIIQVHAFFIRNAFLNSSVA